MTDDNVPRSVPGPPRPLHEGRPRTEQHFAAIGPPVRKIPPTRRRPSKEIQRIIDAAHEAYPNYRELVMASPKAARARYMSLREYKRRGVIADVRKRGVKLYVLAPGPAPVPEL